MKALTVRLPWANLIANRIKFVELRSWQTAYRGPLAIHAGKTVDRDAIKKLVKVLRRWALRIMDGSYLHNLQENLKPLFLCVANRGCLMCRIIS